MDDKDETFADRIAKAKEARLAGQKMRKVTAAQTCSCGCHKGTSRHVAPCACQRRPVAR